MQRFFKPRSKLDFVLTPILKVSNKEHYNGAQIIKLLVHGPCYIYSVAVPARFGIGRFTTEEEIDYTVEKTIKHVKRLREMRLVSLTTSSIRRPNRSLRGISDAELFLSRT